MNFVLDASVALLWLIPESNPLGLWYAERVLESLRVSSGFVPELFMLEVANVIAKLEAKALITEADSQRFITLLEQLSLSTDTVTSTRVLGNIWISRGDIGYLRMMQPIWSSLSD